MSAYFCTERCEISLAPLPLVHRYRLRGGRPAGPGGACPSAPRRWRFRSAPGRRDALPTGGALIVYDNIIDDERRENAFGLLISLNMLIENEGGFDYTGADCRGWLESVGFSESHVEPLVGPTSMAVGIK